MAVERAFFERLWGEATGLIELRLIPEDKRDSVQSFWFAYPSQLSDFVTRAAAANGKQHVFFGVALRNVRSGAEKDCSVLTSFWTDVDAKDHGGDMVAATKLLKEFTLRPSIGVNSGGGWHAYWVLRESIEITAENRQALRGVNKALALAVGGDRKTHDLSRILRVPGTLNIKTKYQSPIECTTVFIRDFSYSPDDFGFLNIIDPSTPKPQDIVRPPIQHSKPIPEELREKLIPIVQRLWVEGHRQSVALFISGLLLKTGFGRPSVEDLIRGVCLLKVDPETDSRIAAVGATYAKAERGETIAGYRALQEITESMPAKQKSDAAKALQLLETHTRNERRSQHKKVPKLLEKLTIEKIVKKPADEPEYVVSFMYEVTTREIVVDWEGLSLVKKFRSCVGKTHDILMMGECEQWEWEVAVNDVLKTVEHRKDAVVAGQKEGREVLKSQVRDILLLRGVCNSLDELSSSNIYRNEIVIYFKWDCLTRALRERNVAFTNRDLKMGLEEMGGKDDRTMSQRFWQLPTEVLGEGKK